MAVHGRLAKDAAPGPLIVIYTSPLKLRRTIYTTTLNVYGFNVLLTRYVMFRKDLRTNSDCFAFFPLSDLSLGAFAKFYE